MTARRLPVVAVPDSLDLPAGWHWWRYGHRPVRHPERGGKGDYQMVPPDVDGPTRNAVWVASEGDRQLLRAWFKDRARHGPDEMWDTVVACWKQLAARPPMQLVDVPAECPGASVVPVRRFREGLCPVGDPQEADLVTDPRVAVVRADSSTVVPAGWRVLDPSDPWAGLAGVWRAWVTPLAFDEYDADRAEKATAAGWWDRWQALPVRTQGGGRAHRR